MIEIKNVSKTYHPKRGKAVKAIDHISLNFNGNGFVFITGKSGSGKSTLLNLIGGLDSYDSGDICILGKSSREFTSSQFDSYRNTYVGFVFQEDNLLEDYNVYENISLALQLQQRKSEENEIEHLLQKLNLKDFEKRKVNELSRGQKQRVALARALIKNPKMILADEPTGNLDSKTSEQVFDFLKEISKEKLVIVVSHDKKMAHLYGDRIIEIKDGQVISDTIKNQETIEEKDTYHSKTSKLPWKESFKLGIGFLKHKKIRLIITTLFMAVSLLFFSVLDTLSSYNLNLAHSKLLKEKGENFVQIEKSKVSESGGYITKDLQPLKKEEAEMIQRKVKDGKPIFQLQSGDIFSEITDVFHIVNLPYEGLFVEFVVDNPFDYLKEVSLIGKVPTSSKEIVISNYIALLMIENGVLLANSDTIYQPKNYQDILNHTFRLGEKAEATIVGIIEYDLTEYQKIEEKNSSQPNSMSNQDYFTLTEYNRKKHNVYNKVFVREDFIEYLQSIEKDTVSRDFSFQLTSKDFSMTKRGYELSFIDDNLKYYDGEKWVTVTDLEPNEIVLSTHQLESSNGMGLSVTLDVFDSSETLFHQYPNLKVVGVTEDDTYYVSSQLLEDYMKEAVPETGIFILENRQKELKKWMDQFDLRSEISLKSTYSDDILEVVHTVELLKKIAYYLALFFFLFAVILISNFMVSSISHRKREIGILRSLGAHRLDVMKVFLWEGILLSLFAFLTSFGGLILVTNLLNKELVSSGIYFVLTPFIVTIRQAIVLFLFVHGIVFFSSIFPIIHFTRKRPIDMIQAN